MIEFVKIDPKETLRQMVADVEESLGQTLYPGDERHLYLSTLAQVVVGLQAELNAKCNRNFLRYAQGEELDEYGHQYNVSRRPAAKASVTMAIHFSEGMEMEQVIPAGTTVTLDGLTNFVFPAAVPVPAGVAVISAQAQAEATGSHYNGFLPGQIATLVNPLPYVASVVNTSTSAGGADEEADDDYRERIRTSYAIYSTAGSEEAYAYYARNAHPDVLDVTFSRPAPVTVQACVLGPDASASPELLSAVEEALSDKRRRPMTDHLVVVSPTIKGYSIHLTYYIAREDYTEETNIKAKVLAAVEEFQAECRSHLGGAINPDGLRRKILLAGGSRIEIASPVYTPVEDTEVAVAEDVVVEYGGLLG